MAEPRPDLNIKVAAFTVTQKLYNTFYGLLTWPLYGRFDAHLNEMYLSRLFQTILSGIYVPSDGVKQFTFCRT